MPGIFLSALVFAVFSNCLQNTFLWDDEQFVVKNAFLTSGAHLSKLVTENIVAGAGLTSNLYRPLQMITHFLDVRLWGYQSWGHHLTNILLHAALAYAVWRVLRGLLDPGPALVAAAFFTLHPLQSEAVAYVSGRGDTLSILFLCMGLVLFRRNRWLALGSSGLAMLSKESAVLFPAFLILYEWGCRRRVEWKHHGPFWALSGLYIAARLTVLNFSNTLNFYNQSNILTQNFHYRLFTYLTTIPKGIGLWIWPHDLHHERHWAVYPSWVTPPVPASAVLVLGLVAAVFLLRKKSPRLVTGILWFFIATIPTSNLLVLINALFYDHWFILPGLGLTIGLGVAVERVWRKGSLLRFVTGAAMALYLTTLGITAFHHNAIWKDPITLYTHILSYEPDSAKICNDLAMALADRGSVRESVRWYEKAIRLDDEYPQTHHNLAQAHLRLGREDRALQELEKASAMAPWFYNAKLLEGQVRLKRGELDRAERAFEETIRLYPYAAEAYMGLAQVYLLRKDKDAAEKILEKGLLALPNHPTLLQFKSGLSPKSYKRE